MYNNIFQVSTEPFSPEREATDADVSAFQGLPMTAIRQTDSRADTLQAFQRWMPTNNFGICSTEGFRFFRTAHKHYFQNRFPQFRKAVLRLSEISESDFCGGSGMVGYLLQELQSYYENQLNTYVMLDDETPITMDEFIRVAEPDTPYYFGSVFDCRFG